MRDTSKLIGTGSEWTFELLEKFDTAIAQSAAKFGLDTYPNQLEVITSEQMLDGYTSAGLPVNYAHWSFGKSFLAQHKAYQKGYQSLAYEIVINSSPCIAYLMEENSLAMQALVIAHACYGHNSFFKGNYLFKQWTQAEAIVDYMIFARGYIAECEERYGYDKVERTLDALHALQDFGVDKYKRPSRLDSSKERAELAKRLAAAEEEAKLHEFYQPKPRPAEEEKMFPAEPEENILYFLEKHGPGLAPWQRELARIVRKISQYFYPQRQTKVMNEGWATFWHYTLLNDLYDRDLIDDALLLECLHSHTNVVRQPAGSAMNPYALGFAMFKDIRRICEQPTAEDREWFPEIAGKDWLPVLHDAMANYRDESFILQFLSPRLIREFQFFEVSTDDKKPYWSVDKVAREEDYRSIRSALADSYRLENYIPDISVLQFRRDSDRALILRHQSVKGRMLEVDNAYKVLRHLRHLWRYPVALESVDGENVLKQFKADPMPA